MTRPSIRGISAELVHLAAALTELDAPNAHDAPPKVAPAPLPPATRGALARALYQERRCRDALLEGALFGEPAWDMLLDLYACQQQGRKTSISSACVAAAGPPTTALRHLSRMLADGLLVREADPADGRRFWVQLSETMAERMDAYLDRVVGARAAKVE